MNHSFWVLGPFAELTKGITAPLVSVTPPVSSAFSCALIIGTHIITPVIAIEMRRTLVAFLHGLQETVVPLRFNLGQTGIVLFTFLTRETVAVSEKS
jgi:hypothetical protein